MPSASFLFSFFWSTSCLTSFSRSIYYSLYWVFNSAFLVRKTWFSPSIL